MLSSTSWPRGCLVSGFCSLMTQRQLRKGSLSCVLGTATDDVVSSISVEGFWAHGATKDGAIRVGEDDDGA